MIQKPVHTMPTSNLSKICRFPVSAHSYHRREHSSSIGTSLFMFGGLLSPTSPAMAAVTLQVPSLPKVTPEVFMRRHASPLLHTVRSKHHVQRRCRLRARMLSNSIV